DRQDPGRGDDGGRHLRAGLALVDLHHAAAEPGAVFVGCVARPHLQAFARRQGAGRARQVRQAAETVRLDSRHGVSVGEYAVCRRVAELAGAEVGVEAVTFIVIASEAKQSIYPLAELWIASSLRSSQ